MTPNRLVAALLACLLVVAGAGCMGGDDGAANRADAYTPPIGSVEGFERKESLLGRGSSAGSAGVTDSYVPKGEIVADSGFRPQLDGFAFENYGNDVGPENMGPAEMEDLFGETVCISGTGDDCGLTPAAQAWMENMNDSMAGGHCVGFSVASLRMHDEALDQEDFGADSTVGLEIVGNGDLQSSIAEHFVYQFLPPVVQERVTGAPSEVLDTLIDALESGDELYTLGIYMPDLSGGHAITPFAVEDRGGGRYAILVYDNNFPGATRAVEVDTNEEYWRYVGGTNPDDLGQVYEGNAETQTLELDPTNPGEQLQPCPFCSDATAADGDAKGAVLPESERYTEITLGGDPRNHPHLVFSDGKGRRTGLVDGKLLQEIPDIEVVKSYALENWETAPEPRYRLPQGKNYGITVDGSSLSKPTKTTVDLVGNGLVIEIEDIKMKPGQQDHMALPGGYGITYLTNGDDGMAPNMFAGLVEDGAAYNFAATAVGIEKGSTLSLLVEQEEKVVILDSTGSAGALPEGTGLFVLQLTRVDANGKVSLWQNRNVRLDGSKEEKAAFEYDSSPTPGKPLPLVLLDRNSDVTDVITAKPLK